MSRLRAQRYLGMTIPQLATLVFLGLCLCITAVGGYWWFNLMVATAYAVPDVPGFNLTSLPTFTPLPTQIPVPTPSPTPITYESLIPAGWKQFTSEALLGLEIWLPPSYVPQTEKEKKDSIKILASEGEQVKSVLVLRDTIPSPYLVFTTFEISTRPIFAADLDEMVDAEFGIYMRLGRLLERDVFEFKTVSYPARRLVFDINASGVDAGLVVYIIQVGGELYYLGFAMPFNETYTRLPDFDRAAQTFRIVTP